VKVDAFWRLIQEIRDLKENNQSGVTLMDQQGRITNKVSTLACVLLCLATLILPACSSQKAEELYKTAQFEELQTNWEHAGQLYEKIIADYPKSEPAEKAKARMSILASESKYPVGE